MRLTVQFAFIMVVTATALDTDSQCRDIVALANEDLPDYYQASRIFSHRTYYLLPASMMTECYYLNNDQTRDDITGSASLTLNCPTGYLAIRELADGKGRCVLQQEARNAPQLSSRLIQEIRALSNEVRQEIEDYPMSENEIVLAFKVFKRSADFDLAQALVDLSIGSRSDGPQKLETVPVLSEGSSAADVHKPTTLVSTPVRHADPVKQEETTKASSTEKQDCLIILQDACYGHKFSRNIRQRDLDSIVERPERTRAAILGILTAQARLKSFGQPHFDITHSERRGWLGDQAVEKVHGLVYPQELLKIAREVGDCLSKGKLEIPESYPYGDLYLGPQSLDAINGCIGAVYDGIDALYAKDYKTTHVCIRPPGHHAAEITPCGFCWVNNVHVAIAYAQEKYGIQRAAILDFDLHHGDGSQAIAWTLNEAQPDSIAYYSLHDIYSYPCESGNIDKIREASVSISAHGHNVHNVHLKPYTTEEQFDQLYEQEYSKILIAAERYLAAGAREGQKMLICISAGYDASEHESSSMQRHKVSVPTSFYERFTKDAVALADKYTNGKVFSVMEGGYGDRAITSASCAHMLGLASSDQPNLLRKDWYNMDNMKLLERTFPCKAKGPRKPVKSDTESSWLRLVDSLYMEHIPGMSITIPPDSSLLDSLGKMTLRERRAGPTTPATAPPVRRSRTPRSSPVKNRGGKVSATPVVLEPVPPLPSLPAHFMETNGTTAQIDSPTPKQVPIENVLRVEEFQGSTVHAEKPEATTPHHHSETQTTQPSIPAKPLDIYDFIE
ncbi:hypothetical protein MRB53_039072 [Persea americana]|nr:hypothetical protein MRB53_039072 [Persea americana]